MREIYKHPLRCILTRRMSATVHTIPFVIAIPMFFEFGLAGLHRSPSAPSVVSTAILINIEVYKNCSTSPDVLRRLSPRRIPTSIRKLKLKPKLKKHPNDTFIHTTFIHPYVSIYSNYA